MRESFIRIMKWPGTRRHRYIIGLIMTRYSKTTMGKYAFLENWSDMKKLWDQITILVLAQY